MPCLVCEKCGCYFIHDQYYKTVRRLEKNSGSRLRKNVNFYLSGNDVKKKSAPADGVTAQKAPKTAGKKKEKRPVSGTGLSGAGNERIRHVRIGAGQVETCRYYKNGLCLYFDGSCNPYSVKCRYPDRSRPEGEKKMEAVRSGMGNTEEKTAAGAETASVRQKESSGRGKSGVTAIVISYNRRCIHQEHAVEDVIAGVRIVTPDGRIITCPIEAGYCRICEEYYILKRDFLKAKKEGILLCPVEDRTSACSTAQGHAALPSGESRIHRYGYNVKKENGYTDRQRQIVLANILENTDIPKYVVKAVIGRCIRQHQGQKNFAGAVARWSKDLEFVENYRMGDIPEVIVERIILR